MITWYLGLKFNVIQGSLPKENGEITEVAVSNHHQRVYISNASVCVLTTHTKPETNFLVCKIWACNFLSR